MRKRKAKKKSKREERRIEFTLISPNLLMLSLSVTNFLLRFERNTGN